MAYEFRFPDIGEGVTEGELLTWKVHEGDVVAEDQTLAEMETDKAVVELPSPRAGRVTRLHAAEGDIIKVGDVVVTIEESGAGEVRLAPTPPVPPGPVAVAGPPAAAAPANVEEPVEAEPYTGSVVGRLEEAPEEERVPAKTSVPPVAAAPSETGVLAMPTVRVLAQQMGVDLTHVRGTGAGGRILKRDVEDAAGAAAYGAAAADRPPSAPAAGPPAGAETPGAPSPVPAAEAPSAGIPGRASLMGGIVEQDAFGTVERVAFRGVRRTMARRMAESVAKQAQVTTMDEADVTIIKRIRKKEHAVAAERGVRLTYLAFVVKACTASLKRFPRLNAVLEEAGDEFVLKRYYNMGIAVDTKDGLVVPNIKNADEKSIFRIAEEIVDLVERADERRLEVRDLHGGTFTITNYGAIGSTYATPVTHYPEVAILGMGRVRELPVVREGKVVNRLLLPLSLTIDHQLIDGAEAARFLNLVIGYLQDPDLLLLEGA